MSGPDLVVVRIRARQVVRYKQDISMPRADYERLKAAPDNSKTADEVADWLDLADVHDADDVEEWELDLVEARK